jgi:hypothetical protein
MVMGQAYISLIRPREGMIATNKERLITLAVHGEIVPAQVNRQYEVTWDGRAKL